MGALLGGGGTNLVPVPVCGSELLLILFIANRGEPAGRFMIPNRIRIVKRYPDIDW
jgi:hypothetical protein